MTGSRIAVEQLARAQGEISISRLLLFLLPRRRGIQGMKLYGKERVETMEKKDALHCITLHDMAWIV